MRYADSACNGFDPPGLTRVIDPIELVGQCCLMLSLTRLIREVRIVDETLFGVRGAVNTLPPGLASDVAIARSLTLVHNETCCLVHPTVRDVVVAPRCPRVDRYKRLSVSKELGETSDDDTQCCITLDVPCSIWQRDT